MPHDKMFDKKHFSYLKFKVLLSNLKMEPKTSTATGAFPIGDDKDKSEDSYHNAPKDISNSSSDTSPSDKKGTKRGVSRSPVSLASSVVDLMTETASTQLEFSKRISLENKADWKEARTKLFTMKRKGLQEDSDFLDLLQVMLDGEEKNSSFFLEADKAVPKLIQPSPPESVITYNEPPLKKQKST